MLVTILHISDLHRDPTHPISNRALLHSLACDLERYAEGSPPIPTPDIVVVSGDIVCGVSPDVPDHARLLDSQYEQATEFLDGIARLFTNGDHGRIVLVPGNHDVSYPHCAGSWKPLKIDKALGKEVLREIVRQSFSEYSRVRWSWETLDFYEIANTDLYLARFEAFARFYNHFYAGQRTFSLGPEEQFDVFDFPQYDVVLAGFNSCFNNDPLNKAGLIHPDCIAGAANTLRRRAYRNRLLLAVWHHSAHGSPVVTDYMDAETLQNLIDAGFSIGFHGHQHKPRFIDEHFRFGAGRKITVISAGTLCGGPRALPSGQSRSYNVVTLDSESANGILYQRQMQNEAFNMPIWGPGRFPPSGESSIHFTVQRPPQRTDNSWQVADLAEAEQLIGEKKYGEAAEILRPWAASNNMARRLLLECYTSLDDAPKIANEFFPPTSTSEIVYVLDALWVTGQVDRLKALLVSQIVSENADPSVREVSTKYIQRVAL